MKNDTTNTIPIWEKEAFHFPDDAPRMRPDGLTDDELEMIMKDDASFFKWWTLAASFSAKSRETIRFSPEDLCWFVEAARQLLVLESFRREGILKRLVLPPVADWAKPGAPLEIELSETGKRMMYPQNS